MKMRSVISFLPRVALGVVLSTALMFVLVFSLIACGQGEAVIDDAASYDEVTNAQSQSEPLTELQIIDVVVGEGPAVEEGDTVIFDWTGYYTGGMMWNSSLRQGEPYYFVVGDGTVIEGWEQGLLGMQVGGERTLYVPYELGFGAEGAHPMVSPYQDLHFEITLLEIR